MISQCVTGLRLGLAVVLLLAFDTYQGSKSDESFGIDLVGPVDLAPAPIINGADATKQEYPMAGALLAEISIQFPGFGKTQVRQLLCSSTLIAPDVVLTAAHCLDENLLSMMVVGEPDIATVNEYRWTRKSNVTKFTNMDQSLPDWPQDSVGGSVTVVPKKWASAGFSMGLGQSYDLGLLFLDEPVLDVDLGYLPNETEAEGLVEGAEVVVIGWGQQVHVEGEEEPPEGSYAIKQQGISYINRVGDHEFQVGRSEAEVRKCHGDSGGPTLLAVETDSSEKLRVVGLSSHAWDITDCASMGGVDTRLDSYRGWLSNQLEGACEDGTRVWCEIPGIIPPPDANGLRAWEDPEAAEVFLGDKGCACSAWPTSTPLANFGFLALLLGLVTRRRSYVSASAHGAGLQPRGLDRAARDDSSDL
jgi:hypothetical protein